MAVFKIFAEKDTTLYSEYETLNSGMDPILELSKAVSLKYSGQSSTARILIKFSDADINDVLGKYVGQKDFQAFLKLNLADSTGLSPEYTLEAYPVYGSWDMGTGHYLDIKTPTNGAAWVSRGADGTNAWPTSSFPAGVTASFTAQNPGGGAWYIDYPATESYSVYTKKDTNIDVTRAIKAFVSGTIANDGFIIKTSGSLEFSTAYSYTLNYFSRDTNTVYPPVLEIKWDSSTYNISGSTASLISNQDVVLSLSNNKEVFNENEIYRFRTSVRDLYPVRTFSTSSIYNQQKLLPSSSYYAIKDLKSNEFVVDFDPIYTKISADNLSNYFDVHMYGLEPERYYKILIKTEISGSVTVFDDRYIFKVVQ